jgi:hypothetical protein
MGFSYRRSFGSGAFRMNVSNRSVSYSVGVKGARINVGSKGTYVNLNAYGINYRRQLGSQPNTSPSPNVNNKSFEMHEVDNIGSADIENLTDIGSKDFVSELSRKSVQISYVKYFGVIPLLMLSSILLFYSFKLRTIDPLQVGDNRLVRVTSRVGVNIRQRSNSKAKVLTEASFGQTFLLLDSTNKKWLKINVNNEQGYINRRFCQIDNIQTEQPAEDHFLLTNHYVTYSFFALLTCFTPLLFWLKRIDKRRFEVVLQYNMDEQFERIYGHFGTHFSNFIKSNKIWQHLNVHQTSDYKRNGGAGKLIKRVPVKAVSLHQAPLPYFVTNVAIPHIKLTNVDFYFLPERLLVKRGNTFAAVFYKNLQISCRTTRFIEDESLPSDAHVLEYTWRYVNKGGGPDRRFNNNSRIPICAYSEYSLTSGTGIYEVITTSKQGAMNPFAEFILQIGDMQSKFANV